MKPRVTLLSVIKHRFPDRVISLQVRSGERGGNTVKCSPLHLSQEGSDAPRLSTLISSEWKMSASSGLSIRILGLSPSLAPPELSLRAVLWPPCRSSAARSLLVLPMAGVCGDTGKREGTGRDPRDRPRTTPLRRRALVRRAPLYLLGQPRLELRREPERNLTLLRQLLPPLSNFRFRPGPAKEGWSLGTERSRLARHHFRFRFGRVRSPAASGRSVRSRSGSSRAAPGTSFVAASRRRSRAPFTFPTERGCY